MSNILLTGGSGFIGKNLNEQLAGKYNILAPTRAELDLTNADNTKSYFKNHKFDVIIHAAGAGSLRTEQNSRGVYELNSVMFNNVVKNSLSFSRMIFFGSGAEYGKQRDLVRVKESEFGGVMPEDEYGKAKFAASEYIASHQNIVNLRLFGVFGRYEDYGTRFISNIICQSLAGQPIVVRQNTIFDYLYINDLAGIAAFFIEHEPKEKFYNAGSGQAVKLMELAKIVKQLTQNPHEIITTLPGLGKEYSCDNTLLMNELGEFKFTPLKQAVEEMVQLYKANWENIDKSKIPAGL